ncbi:MAG: MaoC family dehydratase [Woeseiaceae bacterium]|nr:MaoC family dehydratase [Woeseiaceae bacterium]
MLQVPAAKLADYIDKPLDPSDWLRIDQEQINAFADATHDHQFIHVDPARARATPFGATIAHGYLTLSLVSHFLAEAGIGPGNPQVVINYGSDKVRFLEPVRVDSDVRGRACLLEVREKKPGQVLTRTRVTVEIRGSEKPALIAEILSLLYY